MKSHAMRTLFLQPFPVFALLLAMHIALPLPYTRAGENQHRLIANTGTDHLLLFLPASEEDNTPEAQIARSRELAIAGDAEQASLLLYRALSRPLSDSLLQALYIDIRDILSVEEQQDFKAAGDKALWLTRFWRRSDPTPATTANERYVEHYQRLDFVRRRYRSPQPRGYDDRGMIYLRYGPPEEVFRSPSGRYTRGNESWVYHSLNDASFDFIQFGGLYRLEYDLRKAIMIMPKNSWHLVSLWADLFSERSHLSLAYQITAERLWILLLSQSGENGGMIILNEYLNRAEYRRQELPDRATDFRIEARSLDFVLSHAVFAHSTRQTLPVPEDSSAVVGSKRSRLELYYAIALTSLDAEKLFSAQKEPGLWLYFTLYDKNYDVVLQRRDSITIDLAALLAKQDYVGQITCFVPPDTYFVAIDLQSPDSKQRGQRQIRIAAPDFSGSELALSEIELATEVRPTTALDMEQGFIKHGLYVQPYPYRAMPARQPISVYFEIYNLQPEADGTVRYSVTYEIGNKKKKGLLALLSTVNPFAKNPGSLSLSYDYTASETRRHEYIVLDFSDLHPGRYLLTVRVFDKVANREGEKYLRLKILP